VHSWAVLIRTEPALSLRAGGDKLGGINALTVASLNLHCGSSASGVRYDVAGVISSLRANIICLQEDWQPRDAPDGVSPDPVIQAAASLGVAVYREPMCARDSWADFGVPAVVGPGQLCISVLTALPVTRYEVIPLGHGPGDGIPRIAQVLLLQVPGGRVLRLVNTHLTFSVLSPLQLWRLWRQLKPEPVPTVIAGDLNMPALVARRFPGLRELVSGPTFPAEQPVVQLDHVLVSRAIRAGPGAVLAHAGSDHRPVRAEFRLDRPRDQLPSSGWRPALACQRSRLLLRARRRGLRRRLVGVRGRGGPLARHYGAMPRNRLELSASLDRLEASAADLGGQIHTVATLGRVRVCVEDR